MKSCKGLVTNVVFILAVVLLGNNIFAQKTGPVPFGPAPTTTVDDLRPFDFSDKFYLSNGILPYMLTGRHTGDDGRSVPDLAADQDHNNVRIIATRPAYGPEGKILYWNFYGGFNKDAFTEDNEGNAAYNMAYEYPFYIFPSESRLRAERQAPIVSTTDGYFDKNLLGIGAIMLVEYDHTAVRTKMDAAFLEELAQQNGRSTDGTPVIRTIKQLDQLQRLGLVTISQAGGVKGQTSYIVGKVLRYPEHGAIAPDAFLLYTMDAQEKPLESELFFLKTFECLKKYGSVCYRQ